MRKYSLFILYVFLLISCSNNKWINSNIDGNLLSKQPLEKDDFYQSVNYKDLEYVSISSSNVDTGKKDEFERLFFQQTISMLSQNNKIDNVCFNNKEKQNLIELYNFCNDWEKRDFDGVEPILKIIEKIKLIELIEDFNLLLNDKSVLLFFPFKVNLLNHDNNFHYPDISLVLSFYNDFDSYFDFYKKMFLKCGYSEDYVEHILLEAYKLEKNYNTNLLVNENSKKKIIYWNNIDVEYKNLPLKNILESYGVSKLNYVVPEEEIKVFDSLYLQENLEAIKTLCICNLLLRSSQFLDKESFENYKSLQEKLYGKSLCYTDQELAIRILNSNIPNYLGKIWCKECCSEELFSNIEKFSYEVIEQYVKIISSWEWLYSGTRYNLCEQLKNIKVIVGHSSFCDYSNLVLKNNFFDSILEVILYEKEIQAKKCYKDVDIYEWSFSPQIYNAFYNSTNNSVNILAGYIYGSENILNQSLEEKYAYYGLFIAHEISHIFNFYDSGKLMSNIMTNKDKQILEKKLLELAKYFSSFKMVDELKCNGINCMSEIGADYFAMYSILKIVSSEKDFDYKLFFETYAKNNIYKTTKEYFRIVYERDTHPPYYLRVNVIVQQFNEFYKAFDIKPNDGMYLKKENRMKID